MFFSGIQKRCDANFSIKGNCGSIGNKTCTEKAQKRYSNGDPHCICSDLEGEVDSHCLCMVICNI